MLSYILYHISTIQCTSEGRQNYKNSKKVAIGMTEKEMLDIMGTPDTAFMGNDFLTYPANYQVYSYNNVFGASDYINIVIDTNNSIVEILSSE